MGYIDIINVELVISILKIFIIVHHSIIINQSQYAIHYLRVHTPVF